MLGKFQGCAPVLTSAHQIQPTYNLQNLFYILIYLLRPLFCSSILKLRKGGPTSSTLVAFRTSKRSPRAFHMLNLTHSVIAYRTSKLVSWEVLSSTLR
jgi:hypothetical protein